MVVLNRTRDEDQHLKLSICIATYNRSGLIEATLGTIVQQMRSDVELLVVDGASSDQTSDVMTEYCAEHPEVRYIREDKNSGVDADYDKAVGYARGEYCWLMTDDDLVIPGAVDKICAVLVGDIDLLVVNAEVHNHDFSKLLLPRMLKIDADLSYGAANHELFFANTAYLLTFIGSVVVRRRLWMERDRQPYYGSSFIHVGVIFQAPIEKIQIMAEPAVRIRYGTAMWTPRTFEIWMLGWPRLIWSFERISDTAKAKVSPREPYRNIKRLVWVRSTGAYSLEEYRKHLQRTGHIPVALIVAVVPATWLNTLSSLYISLFGREPVAGLYNLVRSKNSTWVTRRIAKTLGV